MTSRTAGSRSIALMAALCGVVFPAAGAARADVNIVLPADAGVANVRELGARGDGVHDDTGVIEKAMAAANDRLGTVYLPDGVYLVTRPLVQNFRWAFLQGQSRRGTILKLKDRAEGYGDADKGRIMISNVHTGPDAWGSVGAKPAAGHYNMSFNGFIRDLTIDTGKGNPGTIALHYIAHNGGGVRNVTIRSGDGAGLIGLDLRQEANGPCLFKNIDIEGFDYGVVTRWWLYNSTFEHLTLRGQRRVGFLNSEHATSIRGLVSHNAVPAVQNGPHPNSGPLVLIDARCTGGAAGVTAVESAGPIFVRNLAVEGYGRALVNRKHATEDRLIAEFATPPFTTPQGKPATSLALKVAETPEMPWDPPREWVSVLSFAPPAGKLEPPPPGDFGTWEATEALQKAIDSGRSTVYLPLGNYLVRQPIRVRGAVRVIRGMGSRIFAAEELRGRALFVYEDLKGPAVFVDRCSFTSVSYGMPHCTHDHLASAALVLTDSLGAGSYRSHDGAGDFFADGFCGGEIELNAAQRVWIRDLNIEGGQTKVINRRADLWVLGWKTEHTGTSFVNAWPLARTEILGGMIYPGGRGDWTTPVLINEDGRMTALYGMFGGNNTMLRESNRQNTIVVPRPKDQDRCFFMSTEERKYLAGANSHTVPQAAGGSVRRETP